MKDNAKAKEYPSGHKKESCEKNNEKENKSPIRMKTRIKKFGILNFLPCRKFRNSRKFLKRKVVDKTAGITVEKSIDALILNSKLEMGRFRK